MNDDTVATAKDPPGCGAGPPDGEIGLSVAVIVAGNGLIPVEPPLLLNLHTVVTANDPPGCGAGPPDGEIGLFVAIIVTGNGYVTENPPRPGKYAAIATAKDPPSSGARAPNGEVRFSVAVIVTRNGYVPYVHNLGGISSKVISEIGLADAKNAHCIHHNGGCIRGSIYGKSDRGIAHTGAKNPGWTGTIHFRLGSWQDRTGPAWARGSGRGQAHGHKIINEQSASRGCDGPHIADCDRVGSWLSSGKVAGVRRSDGEIGQGDIGGGAGGVRGVVTSAG